MVDSPMALLGILLGLAGLTLTLVARRNAEMTLVHHNDGAWASSSTGKRILAAVLLAGGMLVVLGSFSVWGACSQDPCDGGLFGLMHIYERSGVDLGWGVVTAVLGAAVLVLAASTLRGRRRPLLERLAALSILLSIGAHLYLTAYGPSAADDGLTGTAYLGVYVTAIGAIVVLVASLSPPPERRAAPT